MPENGKNYVLIYNYLSFMRRYKIIIFRVILSIVFQKENLYIGSAF